MACLEKSTTFDIFEKEAVLHEVKSQQSFLQK